MAGDIPISSTLRGEDINDITYMYRVMFNKQEISQSLTASKNAVASKITQLTLPVVSTHEIRHKRTVQILRAHNTSENAHCMGYGIDSRVV